MKRIFHKTKNALRQVRHRRVRAKISGTAQAPRLSVFRGLRSITAQLIDDVKGATLCQVRSAEVKAEKGKTNVAFAAGKLLAEKAIAKKITKVVFDRGGYRYHGRVKALADGARAGGLKF
ncbi:MAG: 50S ribosomal protein L18 [Patescibacteria group bacterium]